jgi:soluble lytic murein transglycosylase
MFSLAIFTIKLFSTVGRINQLRYMLARCLLALGLVLCGNAYAVSNEALLQQARRAYAERNDSALAKDVAQLKAEQYVLAPYADYWLMLLRLERANTAEIEDFLAKNAAMPFTDRVRGEWLKILAKQENWSQFNQVYTQFKRDDIAVECYALLGRAQLGERDALAKAKSLWFTTTDLPSSCTPMFDLLQKTGALNNDDIWARLRIALQAGQLSLAKNIALRLSSLDSADLRLIDRANQTPHLLLIKQNNNAANLTLPSLKTRYGIELSLHAIDRMARSKLEDAISSYKQLQQSLSADDRAYGWGRIAYHAARAHHPQALRFYTLAASSDMDKEQLAWQARAALRASDWVRLRSAIAVMPAAQAEEGAWRYWKARALKETALKNQAQQLEANALFSQLSKERHYYGWLAAEELESVMGNPQQEYTTTEPEVSAIAKDPAIRRALELQRLDMRWEAKAEWVWATRNFNDQQLLAAAEYAARQNWYDIAISTADNTQQTHDFNLRYPTPYRDLIRTSAKDAQVDEAWIYGLTRQESRFMHYAKSGVGASGLMQLMPATAKWAAKRMGMSGYRNDMIHDLSTNIEIGTYYMRYTLDLMSGQAVMATAAYNAGPSRAKRWMAAEPMEAAIYIETIPFAETRGYVQKVMANAHFYAPRLGTKMQSLKSRMGEIPGSAKAEVLGSAKAEIITADNE